MWLACHKNRYVRSIVVYLGEREGQMVRFGSARNARLLTWGGLVTQACIQELACLRFCFFCDRIQRYLFFFDHPLARSAPSSALSFFLSNAGRYLFLRMEPLLRSVARVGELARLADNLEYERDHPAGRENSEHLNRALGKRWRCCWSALFWTRVRVWPGVFACAVSFSFFWLLVCHAIFVV